MSLNIMIKIIKRIIAGFWLLNGLFAQESIFWEIVLYVGV